MRYTEYYVTPKHRDYKIVDKLLIWHLIFGIVIFLFILAKAKMILPIVGIASFWINSLVNVFCFSPINHDLYYLLQNRTNDIRYKYKKLISRRTLYGGFMYSSIYVSIFCNR